MKKSKTLSVTVSQEAVEKIDRLKEKNSVFGFNLSGFINKLILDFKETK